YISRQNLIDNILSFKKLRKETKICAIVKADAYGHGIKGVVPIIKNYVDFFGVVSLTEALEVRKYSSKSVLILSPIEKENILEAVQNQISLSVSNLRYLKTIENAIKNRNLKAKIHLKLNTGMNRLGFSNLVNFKKAVEFILTHDNLILEGVYTHFFDVSRKEVVSTQYEKFCKYKNITNELIFSKNIENNSKNTQNYTKNQTKLIFHCASSNLSLMDNMYCFDMVRLGILLYGYKEVESKIKLKPVLKITSSLVQIQSIKKGQNVGYGNNFTAKTDMKIGIVNLGYADGFLRTNSNEGKVIINNQFANIVGTICMDLFMVDITNIKCKIGDEVIILGSSKNLKIDADDLAKINNTISYEILTNIKKDRFNYQIV
ncbi:MAG: alanine racemase, partial [Clostridiales bacterium]|nr:alanine racemase [Candidatus Apopatousia equi]